MKKKELILKVGNYCKEFRLYTLKLTLIDFSRMFNLNNKNVNAFEFGRANNIQYLFYYYKAGTDEQKEEFSKGLFNIL